MICKSYARLGEYEQAEYIARIIHLVQTNDDAFKVGKALIKTGVEEGLFDRVKIGHKEVYEGNFLKG